MGSSFHELSISGSRLCRRLHIGNVTANVTKKDLQNTFKEFGPILDIFVPKPTDARKNPMYAFITFQNEADAQALVESEHSITINGETLTVAYATPPPGKEKEGSAQPSTPLEAMNQAMALMKKFMVESGFDPAAAAAGAAGSPDDSYNPDDYYEQEEPGATGSHEIQNFIFVAGKNICRELCVNPGKKKVSIVVVRCLQ